MFRISQNCFHQAQCRLPTCISSQPSPQRHQTSIQTWKNHFVSCLSSCDPYFPLIKWYHILLQCDIILNHLRSSRRQPNISAHTCLFVNFNFNRNPLAFPGTKIILHGTPEQRRTFFTHVIDGYYFVPSLKNYR